MRDILVPDKNEAELLNTAHALGYTHAWLLYPSERAYTAESPIPYTCLSTSSKKLPLCIEATLDTIRKLAEHTRPAIIHGVEAHSPKDHIHQRGSGINHIIARFLHTNNTAYAFALAPLIRNSPAERAAILGRIRQNIVLFQKYHVRMLIGSFARTPAELRTPGDTQSLFTILGMQPHELRDAMNERI